MQAYIDLSDGKVVFVSIFLMLHAVVMANYVSFEIFLYFTLYFLIFLCGSNFFFESKKELNLFVVSYAFLYFLCVLLLIHHEFYYDTLFDAYDDDKLFFDWGVELSKNFFVSSYSFYEKFIAIVFKFYGIVGLKPSVYQVLPFNLLASAYTVVLSHRLALLFSKVDLSIKVIFITVLLNYTFSQNSVHLYRDVYIALFSMLFLCSLARTKYNFSILYILLTGLFRLPNAIFLIIVWILYDYSLGRKKAFIRSMSLSVIGAISLLVAIGLGVSVSKYNLGNIDDIVSTRVESFSASAHEAGGGMAIVNSLPFPIRFVSNIYVQVIRPISINDAFTPVRESLKGVRILNHRSIGWALTTISMVFLCGFYVSGLTRLVLLRKKETLILPFIYLLVQVFVIGFLSFLDRHRMFLIPLFPLLYAVSLLPVKSKFLAVLSANYTYFIISFLFLMAVIGTSF